MKLNNFSFELLTHDSSRLEGTFTTHGNSLVAESLRKHFRRDLLNSIPSYAVTHILTNDAEYHYNSDSAMIDQEYQTFLQNVANFLFNYHTYSHHTRLNSKKTSFNSSEKFLAVGEFCGPYEMIVRCGDMKIFSLEENTLRDYSHSTKYGLMECWNPEQVLFKYKGNNQKLIIVLILQEGHLNTVHNISEKEICIMRNMFFNDSSQTNNNILKSNVLAAQRDISPVKNVLREIPYYRANFTPFETISLFEMNNNDTRLNFRKDFSPENEAQIIKMYLNIVCKHPMNILSALEYCFIENKIKYLSDS